MTASEQDASERNHVDVVVDAEGPQTGGYSVSQYKVDGDGYEVAAGEDGDCLDEGINRVEGEASVGSDCFGHVVDQVDMFVPDRVVE